MKLIDITDTYIDLGHWPSHFKISTIVIIPKHNKASYNSSESFHPIMLLNIIRKLFNKMIGERLQFLSISNNFSYPCQLGGLKHRFTTDVDVTLTYIIRSGWVKNLTIDMLAFNITQFFTSLNHQLFSLILNKASFDHKVLSFFKNYLVSGKTKYLWNSFSSPFCNVDIGISQGSALSLILSALYLFLIFHILEKHLKNLKIPILILSFVDDGLFIFQCKSISVSNENLYYSYNVISTLLTKFRLIMKYRKTEVFHFSRLCRVFNPPLLDLTLLGGSVLLPRTIW